MPPRSRRLASASPRLTAARLGAFLRPSAVPAHRLAITGATGFLIVEAVLTLLLKQVDPRDPVGIVYAVLMGVALVGNFVAGVAVAPAATADRRREAELAADLAHLMLRAANLRSAAEAAAQHLATSLRLEFAGIDLNEAADEYSRSAIPLHDNDGVLGILQVPNDLARETRQRLLRVVPTLEALLAAARDRENINKSLIESRQRLERFFDLSSDLMVISDQGHLLQVNPAFERTLGYQVDDLAPAPFDLVPTEDLGRLREPIKELTDGRGPVRFENRATSRDGSPRWIEWSVAPHQGLFYAVGRDVTEQRAEQEQLRGTQTMLEASGDALRALAEQQAALRRIATLVAQGVDPDEVFYAVAEEMGRCLHVAGAAVSRYENDAIAVLALAPVPPEIKDLVPLGERFPLEGDNVATRVVLTGRPARVDNHATGAIADRMRQLGVQSIVAVPIVVGNRVWGMASAGSVDAKPMPADTEERIADFTDLVATAIASAAGREELQASRDTLGELAEHQTGLRRVATLVAHGAGPVEVFEAVYYEMARCVHATSATLCRFEDDREANILAARHDPGMQALPVGARVRLEDDSALAAVFSTGQPARQDNPEAGIVTALGVPVVVDGRVWGAISAGSSGPQRLPSDTETRIADFADLVATAVANTAAREQLDASRDRLRQLARQQTALHRVAELVAREAEPAEVFNVVAEEMAACLDVYNATVARYEGDDIVIAALGRPEVDIPNPPTVGERFPLDGDHVAVTVRRTGRPARMDSHEHAAGASAARIREMGVESMVAVPIVVGAELWGVAAVASRGEPLPADAEAGIADFADLVSTAIANAAAREQLNTSRESLGQLARQQTALRRVAELVAREAEPAAVFNAVAEEMAGCLDAYNATVIRHEGDFLVVEALATLNQDLPSPPAVGARLPLEGDHIAPMILRTGRPARMDSHEHAAGETAAVIRALGIQSMVGVPIVVGGQIWGSAAVGSRSGPLPPDTEVRMADFADLVATSIANAATRAELQAGRDSLRELAESLSVLARQQAALRRVATLVARGVSQSEVFSAVAEEMAGCLNVGNAEVLRYEDDGAAIVVVASYADPGVPHLSLGERLSTEGDNVAATVLSTRQSARMDSWESAAGPIAQRIRELGVRSRIGAPIVVNERLWGIAVVATTEPDPLPPDTEARIVEFAELVATAIAAATTRAELIASRARIVAAADDARRRLERDIHDGAQQRLVSLGLKLRLTEESVPSERDDLKSMLTEAVSGLTDVFQELQELSRGLHPAILSTGGLRAAFKTLARRSPVPVNLDVTIEQRLPESVEVAAYYVVAEALTNAAKHARASEVRIRARTTGASLDLLISDDGIGGADSGRGSGLIGLKDRIEVLGGRMHVVSPPGGGTTFDITIPHKQTEDDYRAG